ncbi:hypothetical protein HOC13_01090 [Candidatus Woesearchaeota archaeon]|jgi:large subunit ribosomal protein L1|nr:hypothetical protein [Candidatus Woesearchaeota archaeon]
MITKEQVQKAIEQLKQNPKRKFSQSYDLIINLKNISIKQNPLDFFTTIPYPKKQVKIAAFVGIELSSQAEKSCDLVIQETDFSKYQDKKVSKKLAEEYDYFIAQANLMPKVAQNFGKSLGIKGKMPNPKLGCVIPPNANISDLAKRLHSTIRLVAKKATNLQCLVGKEDQPDEEVIDNIIAAYNATLKQVPNEIQNIKNVQLKLTMSKPVNL